MARQDKDSFVDPAVVAAWRRMLWLVRGSADVVEALVPVAAGMTKEEVSRLLTRAGAPSGKGVEPVEQVLGLLGVVPRARYEALLKEHEALLDEFEELGSRVGEAEQNIERLRGVLRDQGLADEAEQLLDSWGGLVRRTLRAQAGFVRSIASAAGNATPPEGPGAGTPEAQPGMSLTPATDAETEAVEARKPEPAPEPPQVVEPDPVPPPAPAANGATRKRPSTRARAGGTSSRSTSSKRPKRAG
jgi:DNA-binding transcriptional ArsR family regulator